MQTFTAASAAEPDPSKHVKYSQGMVLGADDFTQEFAFHNGRNEWLLRDLIGYGTASGLRVSYDTANGKNLVRVTAGTAVSPRGEMIRVCCDQCADLPTWVAGKQKEITDHLGSPMSGDLSLYVTLCYRECPTDQVPIPGEPCRSEIEATAPSRLKSDFTLELRFEPPRQTEDDVLRRMIDWLRQIPVVEGGGFGSPPETVVLADVLDAVRQAARDAFASVAESPPSSPPDIFVGSPPSALVIPAGMACDIWCAVFRLWVTELRPTWQARFHAANACCSGDAQKQPATKDACVLLAELSVPLQLDGQQLWQISGPVDIIEDQRPYLLHLRLLQEWLLCANSGASDSFIKSGAVTHPPGLGVYSVVAAGRVKGSQASGTVVGLGTALPYNNLRVLNDGSTAAGLVLVTFDDYKLPLPGDNQYLIKVLPTLPATGAKAIVVMFEKFTPGFFQLHVTSETGTDLAQKDLANLELMIEVSEFPA